MKRDPLVIQSQVILIFLIVQYIFGIMVNLFVQFPDTKSESVLWEFAKSQVPLIIHIVLGALLLVGASVFVMRAVQSESKQWIISANVGFFAVLIAVIAGAKFVPSQQDIFSFVMAIAFIVAVLAYGWGIYKAKK